MKGEKKAASSCSVKSLFYTIQKKQSSVVKELQQAVAKTFIRSSKNIAASCVFQQYLQPVQLPRRKQRQRRKPNPLFVIVCSEKTHNYMSCNVILRAWFIRHKHNLERTKTFTLGFVFVFVLAHEHCSLNRLLANYKSLRPNRK